MSEHPVRIVRHADHDPSLTCRPALGYGLCEVLGPGDGCTCPHDWTNTPPDLTAAGNQGPSTRTWTRMLTVRTCPVHGERPA